MSGENEIYYDVFLDLINMGYKVVLAHPERYISFQKDFNKVYELKNALWKKYWLDENYLLNM